MKKIFTLIATALLTMGASAQTTVFSWEAGTATGGTVEAKGSNNAPDDTKITVNSKKADIDVNNVTITLNEALAAGDKIAITGYRNKDTDANGTLYIDFSTGTAIDEGDEVKWNNMALGQEANTNEYTITDQAGSTVIRMARSKASTNVFITKFVITRASGGGGGGGGDESGKITYSAITVAGDVATLAPEFAAVVNEQGVATNVADAKSIVVINKGTVTATAVGSALPANADGGAQKITPKGEMIDTENHIYEDSEVSEWSDITWKKGNCYTDGNINVLATTGVPYTKKMKAQEVWNKDASEWTGTYKAAYDYYLPDGSNGLPVSGAYFTFMSTEKGAFKVMVWSNKDSRKTYVVKKNSAQATTLYAEGYINGQNWKQEDADAGKIDASLVGKRKYLSVSEIQALHDASGVDAAVIGNGSMFWGYLLFDAEANKEYWIFQESSQLGFGGFEFTPGAKAEDLTAIEAITTKTNNTNNANAPMYNLSGQKVDKSYKGIVIQNGRKFMNK